MSGNRKQDQAKPDCGDEAKAQSTNHRETTVTAPVLDSTQRTSEMKWQAATIAWSQTAEVRGLTPDD